MYLNFDMNPKLTEEEFMQMLEKSRREMGKSQEIGLSWEEKSVKEDNFNVSNFGAQEDTVNAEGEKWDLSGTINQCIIRYAARLDADQMNEILLGLENGLTDTQVKSYFILPANKMRQYRRAFLIIREERIVVKRIQLIWIIFIKR